MKCSVLHIALVCLSVGGAALGQTDLERFNRQLEQIHRDTRLLVDPAIPAGQRALVDYGLVFTSGFLAIDDEDQETRILRQQELDAYALVSLDGAHEFFVRGLSRYRDFNTGDSFDSHGDDWVEPTLERGYYSFNLQRYLAAYEGKAIGGNVVFRGGRQLVHWANGLVLSKVLDGATIELSHGPVRLDGVAGTTRRSITDIDSSRPGYDGDTQRDFYGGIISYTVTTHTPYVYGLVQNDRNEDDALVVGPITTRFEYDSWYLGCGSSGSLGDRWLYSLEVAYEGGDGLSNSFNPVGGGQVTQTEEDISALAVDLRLDFLVQDANRTRLTGEVLVATGDTDRLTANNTFGGNAPGTDDEAFNAFGLIDTGLSFAPDVSNLIMVRGGASTFPMPGSNLGKRLQVGSNVFIFAKTESRAPIGEETNDGSYLGTEIDLFLNWQISSDLSVPLRYGVFFPGDAIAVDHDPRHFLYTAIVLAF